MTTDEMGQTIKEILNEPGFLNNFQISKQNLKFMREIGNQILFNIQEKLL